MEIFINEASFHSQYADIYTFQKAFNIFLSSIKRISNIIQKKHTYNEDLFHYTGLKNTHLGQILKSNRDLNNVFLQNLQLLNPKSWRTNQKHDLQSSYFFSSTDFVGTSVAEITERKIIYNTTKSFLLNFNDSIFGNNSSIQVLKDNKENVKVDCIIDIESLESWLIDNKFIELKNAYDKKLSAPPKDYQTILSDKGKFKATSFLNQGRIMYKKLDADQYWVVDNLHYGEKAHIEVFSSVTMKQTGTSVYNEDSFIKLPKKKTSRRMR